MWQKRISEVDAGDIRLVVDTARQEGLQVEFKQEFPGGAENDKGKRGIAKELVAFANAHGGTLIIGIAEDSEHRAVAIRPVADCRAVADRLSSTMHAIIDPPLPGVECEGIPTEPDGTSGVVAIRVPESLSSPHWLRLGKDTEGGVVLFRRNTSSMLVSSMRDIHEMVLATENKRVRLEGRFAEALNRGTDFLYGRGNDPAKYRELLFAIIAQPLSAIQVIGFLQTVRKYAAETEFPLLPPNATRTANLPFNFVNPKPRLRGAQRSNKNDWATILFDDGEDGSVATFLQLYPESPEPSRRFGYSWALGALASTLARVEKLRNEAGAPDTVYEVRVQLHVPNNRWIYKWALDPGGMDTVEIGNLREEMPSYFVGGKAEFSDVELQFNVDLQNALGRFEPSPLQIDWSRVFI